MLGNFSHYLTEPTELKRNRKLQPIETPGVAKLIELLHTKNACSIFQAVSVRVFKRNQWVSSVFSLGFNQLAIFTWVTIWEQFAIG